MIDLKVDIKEFGDIVVNEGENLYSILKKVAGDDYKKYLCAKIENEIKHLGFELREPSKIEFLDITDKDAHRVYVRTLCMILVKACKNLYEGCRVFIEHSLNKGLYIEVYKDGEVMEVDGEKIKAEMQKLIDKELPITRTKRNLNEADEIFKKQGMTDKLRLSKYRKKDKIHVYELDGFYDKYYGYLAVNTSHIDKFDVKNYKAGIILLFPRSDYNYNVPPLEDHSKLAVVFKEAEEWGKILDVWDVGALNDKVLDGSIYDFIRVCEALHEKKIAKIADEICEDENKRIILIAGPSSSGKTTFANRLSIQLMVNGKKPVSISLDDYFVNREDTPVDENGDYDFESIDAIDIETFNRDLLNLMNGEEVELPSFNFVTGSREYKGHKMKIDKNQPIIIEGIHGLNEKLSKSIPHENKFKIYISALTQLNVDMHNRIPTTDLRLIRRMVRDYKYRGNDVNRTLKLWASVRRGEERNIFPFQEEADVMFNSALVYELGVLKKHAEPLLSSIDKKSPYYGECKRLLRFLDYFADIKEESSIPNTSIIKEFIGGSCFRGE